MDRKIALGRLAVGDKVAWRQGDSLWCGTVYSFNPDGLVNVITKDRITFWKRPADLLTRAQATLEAVRKASSVPQDASGQ